MKWEDITINQYKAISKIDLNQSNEIDSIIDLLVAVTGKTSEEILDMPMDEFNILTKELDFLKEVIKPRMKSDKYIVDGKEYRLTANAKSMTAGQYIDYTTTLQADPENFGMICATILVPKGKKYGEGYDPLEISEVFNKHFKMVDVMGVSFFFLKTSEALMQATLCSLNRKLKKELKKETDPKRKEIIIQAMEKIRTTPLGS